MINYTTYELLDSLATRFIPEGRHRYLHVDNREAWITLMGQMIDSGLISPKASVLVKYARFWETVLIGRISLLN